MSAIRDSLLSYGRYRDPRFALLLEDAINLLPYRPMRRARRRRQLALQFLLAACLGLCGALASGYWQHTHAVRNDARRAQLERRLRQLEPALAEGRRLERAIAAYARRAALIASLAVSRDDLFYLLQALGRDRVAGLVLDQIHLRAGGATVTGVAPDRRVLTTWAGQLERAIGLTAVEVVDIEAAHRRDPAPRNTEQTGATRPMGFSVHITVGDSAADRAADARFGPMPRPKRKASRDSAASAETPNRLRPVKAIALLKAPIAACGAG